VRANAEPVALKAQEQAEEVKAWSVNAYDISKRINEGEEVTQEDKKALADFNYAIMQNAVQLKMCIDFVVDMIQTLPEKK